MTGRLDELLGALDLGDGQPADLLGVADAIWLASRGFGQASATQGPVAAESDSPEAALAEPAPHTDFAPAEREGASPSAAPTLDRPPDEPRPQALPAARVAMGTAVALPFSVPAPNPIGDRAALVNALRRLRRQVEAPHHETLDEEATAERVAETGLLDAVLRPGSEPWLQLDLVVDRGPSMAPWRDTLDELVRLLIRECRARSLRLWSLDTRDPDRATVSAGRDGSTARDPRALHRPGRRQAIVVFTDAVSAAWQTGAVTELLRVWAGFSGLAVLQVLPEPFWGRTGLAAGAPAELRPGRDPWGPPEATLTQRRRRGRGDAAVGEDHVAVAVLPLVPRPLRSWLAIVAHEDGRAAARALPLARRPLPPRVERTGLERLATFEQAASEPARRLAARLSASPVVTLPLIRLLRAATLGAEGHPSHDAEVLLGGLLRRDEDHDEVNRVSYAFHDGVREALWSRVSRSERLDALQRTSAWIAQHLGALRGFSASLSRPTAAAGELVAEDGVIAQVAAQVLRAVSPRHAAALDAAAEQARVAREQSAARQDQAVERVPPRVEAVAGLRGPAPAPPELLVGRASELGHARGWISARGSRPNGVVVGPPGAGKSALLAEALREDQRPVFWVEVGARSVARALADLLEEPWQPPDDDAQTARGLQDTMARTDGRVPPTVTAAAEDVRRRLAEAAPCVLVLDDVRDPEDPSLWLDPIPGVQVLMTQRPETSRLLALPTVEALALGTLPAEAPRALLQWGGMPRETAEGLIPLVGALPGDLVCARALWAALDDQGWDLMAGLRATPDVASLWPKSRLAAAVLHALPAPTNGSDPWTDALVGHLHVAPWCSAAPVPGALLQEAVDCSEGGETWQEDPATGLSPMALWEETSEQAVELLVSAGLLRARAGGVAVTRALRALRGRVPTTGRDAVVEALAAPWLREQEGLESLAPHAAERMVNLSKDAPVAHLGLLLAADVASPALSEEIWDLAWDFAIVVAQGRASMGGLSGDEVTLLCDLARLAADRQRADAARALTQAAVDGARDADDRLRAMLAAAALLAPLGYRDAAHNLLNRAEKEILGGRVERPEGHRWAIDLSEAWDAVQDYARGDEALGAATGAVRRLAESTDDDPIGPSVEVGQAWLDRGRPEEAADLLGSALRVAQPLGPDAYARVLVVYTDALDDLARDPDLDRAAQSVRELLAEASSVLGAEHPAVVALHRLQKRIESDASVAQRVSAAAEEAAWDTVSTAAAEEQAAEAEAGNQTLELVLRQVLGDVTQARRAMPTPLQLTLEIDRLVGEIGWVEEPDPVFSHPAIPGRLEWSAEAMLAVTLQELGWRSALQCQVRRPERVMRLAPLLGFLPHDLHVRIGDGPTLQETALEALVAVARRRGVRDVVGLAFAGVGLPHHASYVVDDDLVVGILGEPEPGPQWTPDSLRELALAEPRVLPVRPPPSRTVWVGPGRTLALDPVALSIEIASEAFAPLWVTEEEAVAAHLRGERAPRLESLRGIALVPVDLPPRSRVADATGLWLDAHQRDRLLDAVRDAGFSVAGVRVRGFRDTPIIWAFSETLADLQVGEPTSADALWRDGRLPDLQPVEDDAPEAQSAVPPQEEEASTQQIVPPVPETPASPAVARLRAVLRELRNAAAHPVEGSEPPRLDPAVLSGLFEEAATQWSGSVTGADVHYAWGTTDEVALGLWWRFSDRQPAGLSLRRRELDASPVLDLRALDGALLWSALGDGRHVLAALREAVAEAQDSRSDEVHALVVPPPPGLIPLPEELLLVMIPGAPFPGRKRAARVLTLDEQRTIAVRRPGLLPRTQVAETLWGAARPNDSALGWRERPSAGGRVVRLDRSPERMAAVDAASGDPLQGVQRVVPGTAWTLSDARALGALLEEQVGALLDAVSRIVGVDGVQVQPEAGPIWLLERGLSDAIVELGRPYGEPAQPPFREALDDLLTAVQDTLDEVAATKAGTLREGWLHPLLDAHLPTLPTIAEPGPLFRLHRDDEEPLSRTQPWNVELAEGAVPVGILYLTRSLEDGMVAVVGPDLSQGGRLRKQQVTVLRPERPLRLVDLGDEAWPPERLRLAAWALREHPDAVDGLVLRVSKDWSRPLLGLFERAVPRLREERTQDARAALESVRQERIDGAFGKTELALAEVASMAEEHHARHYRAGREAPGADALVAALADTPFKTVRLGPDGSPGLTDTGRRMLDAGQAAEVFDELAQAVEVALRFADEALPPADSEALFDRHGALPERLRGAPSPLPELDG